MAYLGSKPSSGFITTAKQRITSSTNNYVDLDNAISSLADVIVWVNFVKQDSTNLTLTTSTRITLGGTLVSSDIVEIAYLGKAVATQTPSSGTVTSDMLAGSIANSKLANSSITLNGSAVSLGGSATVDNTPAFHAFVSSNQAVSNATETKAQFDSEVYDTDNAFDSSTNYRFTPQTAGKYFFYTQLRLDSGSNNNNIDYVYVEITKNGAGANNTMFDFRSDRDGRKFTVNSFQVIDMNGSTDYVEVTGTISASYTADLKIGGGPGGGNSYFGGYKIIT
jgi:hypothetical protein